MQSFTASAYHCVHAPRLASSLDLSFHFPGQPYQVLLTSNVKKKQEKIMCNIKAVF